MTYLLLNGRKLKPYEYMMFEQDADPESPEPVERPILTDTL